MEERACARALVRGGRAPGSRRAALEGGVGCGALVDKEGAQALRWRARQGGSARYTKWALCAPRALIPCSRYPNEPNRIPEGAPRASNHP